MLNVFSKIFKNNTAVLDEKVQSSVYNYLKSFCNPDDTIKRKHNDNIRDNVTHKYDDLKSYDDFDDFDE